MNYLEALRSGKRYRPFKRIGDQIWRLSLAEAGTCTRTEDTTDLLAEWETLEEEITVTRAEVERAWEHAMVLRPVKTFTPSLGEFLKALGFK